MLSLGKMNPKPSCIYSKDLQACLDLQRPWACPWGQGSLTPLKGCWRTDIQAGLERPMDKLLLAKNPTNFTLQWGTTCVLADAFKWTVNYWRCFWSSIILTNLKNSVSYLTEQLIFFIKCWQIYFLSEIKMALFSLECTNVLFIYIYFLKISLIFTEFMSFALGLFFS